MNYKSSKITFNKILYLLSPEQKKSLAFVFILLVFGTILEMVGILILVPLMSIFSGLNNLDFLKTFIGLSDSSPEKIISYLLIIIVSFYFLKFLFLVYLSWKQSHFIANLSMDLTSELFKGYLNQSYLFHIQNNTSTLLRNLQAELGQFTTYIQSAVLFLLEFMTIVGIGAILIYEQPIAAFVSAIFFVIVLYFFNRYTKNKILDWGKVRQEQAEKINKHFFQGLGGIKEVKFYGKENFFLNEVIGVLKANADVSSKYLTLGQVPRYFLEFMALLGIFIVIIFMQIIGMDPKSIFPLVGLYLVAAFRIIPSINRVINSLQSMKYLNPVIEVLFNEFKLIKNSLDYSKKMNDMIFRNQIELHNISFSYPESESKVLDKINITIKKGTTIGIIGQSGSGKSTLIDILLGLHTQSSGEILVDGVNIKDNIRGWQKKIGYVPQNVYLLDDTIKANVALGVEPKLIDDDLVTSALKSAQLKDFIDKVPRGNNSIVGERGVKLSGGQKQRIGIARALYSNPDILVLDEATSALDNKNELNFMNTIMSYKNSKTIIIVAHRLSTLKSCDVIYEILNGKIVKTDNK